MNKYRWQERERVSEGGAALKPGRSFPEVASAPSVGNTQLIWKVPLAIREFLK